jgi:hypothetical protein
MQETLPHHPKQKEDLNRCHQQNIKFPSFFHLAVFVLRFFILFSNPAKTPAVPHLHDVRLTDKDPKEPAVLNEILRVKELR